MKPTGTWRTLLPAIAVAATVGTFLTGPYMQSQAFPTETERTCAHAALPHIPMHCIKGYAPTVDRIVTTDREDNPYLNGVANLNAG